MKSDLNSKIDFKKVLKEETSKIGLDLTDQMLINFEIYKDLLIEWNEKMNLTAITDEYQIIMKHFVDCLEVVKYIKQDSKLIDVGTGAGFPGIVVAIYFNDNVKITLLDSLNKRLIFLQEVIEKINLKKVKIVHARAEEKAHDINFREKYDVVVSRAVAGLPILIELDIPYLKTKGKALLLKGDNVKKEIQESKKAMELLNCKVDNIYQYKYIVEEEEYNRSIIEITKQKPVSIKYPRKYGQIKSKPLI